MNQEAGPLGELSKLVQQEQDSHTKRRRARGKRPEPKVPRTSSSPGGTRTLFWARTSIKQATSWSTAQGTLARILRSHYRGNRESAWEEPTPREREAARLLHISASSGSAREALEAGKLLSLSAQLGPGGRVVISGRARKEALARLLGIEELHVVMNTERLVTLVMTDAHQEDHRQDTK